MTRRILIVGPAWVGDMVMAETLFASLRANDPDCELDVLAPAWTFPLLKRMPAVNEALAMPFGHGQLNLLGRYRLGRELRQKKYAQAIVLPNSFKSALIPWWAGIPIRTGFRGEMRYGLLNDLRILDKKRYPLMVERFLVLGLPESADLPRPNPHPVLLVSESERAESVKKRGLDPSAKPLLILCPGAEFGPSKQWALEHFATVAKQKVSEGWQVWLMGSASDRVVAEEIQQMSGVPSINLAGQTSLGEAIDLMSFAHGVVSNDSGLMHVAAALNRPLIAVYGSTSPTFTPPLSPRAKVVQLNLPCQPCFQRQCPLKHHHCMRELSPQMVLEAMSGWGS